MMRACDRFLPQLDKVRPNGSDRWLACCPAHNDRHPSLSLKQVEDRLLLRCWAGCSSSEIVSALKLGLSDLFDDKGTTSRSALPIGRRKVMFRQRLEEWRSGKLTQLCRLLRDIEKQTALAADLILHCDESSTGPQGQADKAWERLAFCHKAKTPLEHDFLRLNSRSEEQHLEVWREWRAKDKFHVA